MSRTRNRHVSQILGASNSRTPPREGWVASSISLSLVVCSYYLKIMHTKEECERTDGLCPVYGTVADVTSNCP